MASGPEHFKQAEQLLDDARNQGRMSPANASLLAEAQVHATLAHAAALAEAVEHAEGDKRGATWSVRQREWDAAFGADGEES